MTNDQRKKILDYLSSDAERLDKLKDQNLLRPDENSWLIREDRLPVSKVDGSCLAINERLIDPLLFDWLVETLPAGEPTRRAKALSALEKLNIEQGDRLTCIERLAIMLASKREPDWADDRWTLSTEDIDLGTVSVYTGIALPSIPGMRDGEDRTLLDEHMMSLPYAKLKDRYMAKARKTAENFFISFYDEETKKGDKDD